MLGRFVTKDEDPTGLLNEGQRYRDLETGAFITRDPLGFIDGPNMYSYVMANPWTKFDPHGLSAKDDDDSVMNLRKKMLDDIEAGPSEGQKQAGKDLQNLVETGADVAAGMTPMGAFGEFKNGESATGKPLAWWERGLAFFGFVPAVKGGATAVDVTTSALKTSKQSKAMTKSQKITTTSSGDALDAITTRQVGEIVSQNPVAAKAYEQIQKSGANVNLDFVNAPRTDEGLAIAGEATGSHSVDIFVQNNKSTQDVVSTLVHESSHIRGASRGIKQGTRQAEYQAARREFLFNNGRKPSFGERQQIWNTVNTNYADLPLK